MTLPRAISEVDAKNRAGSDGLDATEPAVQPLEGHHRCTVHRLIGQRRVPVELPWAVRQAEQRLDLRGKCDHGSELGEVQRLDPEAIPRQDETAPAPVVQRDREHPANLVKEALLPRRIQMGKYLAVGPGRKARSRHLASQLRVVVDLAVSDKGDKSAGVEQRLVAVSRIHQREPPEREANWAVELDALAVRTSVRDGPAHGLQQ